MAISLYLNLRDFSQDAARSFAFRLKILMNDLFTKKALSSDDFGYRDWEIGGVTTRGSKLVIT